VSAVVKIFSLFSIILLISRLIVLFVLDLELLL